jgi:hypothetical protein
MMAYCSHTDGWPIGNSEGKAMTKQEIADAIYEVLNGLTIGWQLANVKDDAKREYLQAPIIAAQAAAMKLLGEFDPDGSLA